MADRTFPPKQVFTLLSQTWVFWMVEKSGRFTCCAKVWLSITRPMLKAGGALKGNFLPFYFALYEQQFFTKI
jgi:hypothetical protein